MASLPEGYRLFEYIPCKVKLTDASSFAELAGVNVNLQVILIFFFAVYLLSGSMKQVDVANV